MRHSSSELIKKNEFAAIDEKGTSGAVFLDSMWDGNTAKAATVADYKNNGPKNEVYLDRGQGVAFNISDVSMDV